MEKENKNCGCGLEHEEKHEHECGCGCEHDYEEFDTMVITLDDDTEIECFILGTFDHKDASYIALLPVNEDDGDEVFIYNFNELDDEEIELNVIEDEDLFDEVSNKFEELFLEEE